MTQLGVAHSIRMLRRIRALRTTRNFAVYAVGDGWTGALGTGRFDQHVVGHDDDDEYTTDYDDQALPVKIYDAPVHAVSTGWGHTAIIPADQSAVLIAGRPHDFSALLRLHRLPPVLRDYMIQQTLAGLPSTTSGASADNLRMHPAALVGRFVTWLSEIFQTPQQEREWAIGARFSILPTFTPLELPDSDTPVSVKCSAGLTAIVGASGKLYTFGLNGFGQCGVGRTSNNVWQPTAVTGLSKEFAAQGPRSEMPQSHPIQSVAVGLQHAACLNNAGEIFAWGKGDRGQLGQETVSSESHTATPIRKAVKMDESSDRPSYLALGTVTQIDCGMLHTAALTVDNEVLIWGKNVLPPSGTDGKPATDSRLPALLRGLPTSIKVERIACGSHHTAVLLADGSVWAVGVSTDTNQPMHDPIEMIPSGTIEMPVRQFEANMDRTTIVGATGQQVLQVHLWKDPELRDYAVFTPPYVDRLLDHDKSTRIREIHRSWKHSIIVTD